jgi:hypothetical protein
VKEEDEQHIREEHQNDRRDPLLRKKGPQGSSSFSVISVRHKRNRRSALSAVRRRKIFCPLFQRLADYSGRDSATTDDGSLQSKAAHPPDTYQCKETETWPTK